MPAVRLARRIRTVCPIRLDVLSIPNSSCGVRSAEKKADGSFSSGASAGSESQGRGFSRGGAAGSGVCGLTVLHCAAKLVRQDSGATGWPRSVLHPSAEASLRIAPCRDGGCGRSGAGVRRCAVESERPIEGERVVAGIRGGVEPVRMRRDFPTAILRKGRIRSPSDSFFRFIFITWLLLLFLSLAMFRHLNRATNGQKIG